MSPQQWVTSLATFLDWALREYHRQGSRAHSIDTRPAEALRGRLLLDGPAALSHVRHGPGETEPSLVTIAEAIQMVAGGDRGAVSPRNVQRWAKRGEITARMSGENWLVDPESLRERLTGRQSA